MSRPYENIYRTLGAEFEENIIEQALRRFQQNDQGKRAADTARILAGVRKHCQRILLSMPVAPIAVPVPPALNTELRQRESEYQERLADVNAWGAARNAELLGLGAVLTPEEGHRLSEDQQEHARAEMARQRLEDAEYREATRQLSCRLVNVQQELYAIMQASADLWCLVYDRCKDLGFADEDEVIQ